ncbi:MAG: tetratricopeptide repeat protein [Filimonas sp.]|nr:tetratricopeptide repeat protein [Filimonas sp.]
MFKLMKVSGVVVLLSMLLMLGATVSAQGVRKRREDLNVDDMLALATKNMKSKNYQQAIAYCREGLSRRPDYSDLHYVLGRLFMLTNKPDSAKMEFNIVLQQNPRYHDAYFSAISLEQGRLHYEEALCYADDALYYFPNDREFMLKKMALLAAVKDSKYTDDYAESMRDKFPTDTAVLTLFINYKLDRAAKFVKQGLNSRALYDLESVLAQDPYNKDALEYVVFVSNRMQLFDKSLSYVNNALFLKPNDYELLMKKILILDAMHNYPEAIEVIHQAQKIYPADSKLSQLEISSRMDAGAYYLAHDSYVQFSAVLEKQPSNREALNYLINMSYSRGAYAESLGWLNKALKYYPSDRLLLTKKAGVLEATGKYGQATGVIEKLYTAYPNGYGYRETYLDLLVRSGKDFYQQELYDSAAVLYKKAIAVDPSNHDALNYLVITQERQKKYKEALQNLDKMAAFYPKEEADILFRKQNILQLYRRIPDAEETLYYLIEKYPAETKYKEALADLKYTTGRAYLQDEQFETAREEFNYVLSVRPDDIDVLNYMINIESATQQYDSAMFYIDRAIALSPVTNKDLLLKKAATYEAMKQYKEAYAITGDLYKRYPYNAKIKSAYVDAIIASGVSYRNRNIQDTALIEFGKALSIQPKDSTALMYSINLLNSMNQYDTALALVNKGLIYYPDNLYFLMKKAVLLENKQMFPEAALYADTVAKRNPTPGNIDYASYLKSKQLKNQFGLMFLSSTYDYNQLRTHANIGTIEYTRFKSKGTTFSTRLNFAGRPTGTGIQLELETYYTHNKKWSSFANVSFANQVVFPKIRLAYSLFHNFKHAWEGELGLRYLNFDTTSTLSVVGSVAKTIGDFWINVRGYLTIVKTLDKSQGNVPLDKSATILARQYITKTDYLRASIGIGSSPDEFSRNFQFVNNVGITTYSIGVGYYKVFNYRNTLGINGDWYNQKVTPDTYRNQYDIYVSFQRKF